MNINIYFIQKKLASLGDIEDRFIKLISNFAKINQINAFSKQIAKAQEQNINAAKLEYTKAYLPYLKPFSIALNERSKCLNSLEFAKLLKDKSEINFFIGGAYGFSDDFIKHCDFSLSLSALTFSHELARIVLLEQIYRGFCINANHPYHK